MDLIRRTFGASEISASHPLDVLHRINPEIASLAYADNSGILGPGIRPYVALFRKLQSNEKIALIEGITRKYGFDAQITINKDSQDGMNYRTDVREKGMTERGVNEGRTLVDLAKLKYEFGRAVVRDHIEGKKYLSDNELRAVRYESEAAVESVRLSETLRADTSRRLSRDNLMGIIRSSEIKYAGLIRQAEEARGMGRDAFRKGGYAWNQASLNRVMTEGLIEGARVGIETIDKIYYWED